MRNERAKLLVAKVRMALLALTDLPDEEYVDGHPVLMTAFAALQRYFEAAEGAFDPERTRVMMARELERVRLHEELDKTLDEQFEQARRARSGAGGAACVDGESCNAKGNV